MWFSDSGRPSRPAAGRSSSSALTPIAIIDSSHRIRIRLMQKLLMLGLQFQSELEQERARAAAGWCWGSRSTVVTVAGKAQHP